MRVLRTRPLAGPSAAIIRARAGADLAIARAICGESGRRTPRLARSLGFTMLEKAFRVDEDPSGRGTSPGSVPLEARTLLAPHGLVAA